MARLFAGRRTNVVWQRASAVVYLVTRVNSFFIFSPDFIERQGEVVVVSAAALHNISCRWRLFAGGRRGATHRASLSDYSAK